MPASYTGKTVATHERDYRKAQQILVLDHYLDVLIEKPGAFPGSLPPHQARVSGEFPKAHDRLWSQLVSKSGQGPGTRQMIEVMLLHRTHSKSVVRDAVDQALSANAIGDISATLPVSSSACWMIASLRFTCWPPRYLITTAPR